MSARRFHTFGFRDRSAAFDHALTLQIRQELEDVRHSLIPRENSLHFSHGETWRTKPAEFADAGGEFQTHSVETSLKFEDVREHRLAAIAEFRRALIEGMQRQFFDSVFATIGRATEKTGNTVSALDHASLADAFLETIKKIQFGVDRDGNISMPEFHGGPDVAMKMAASIEEKGPEFGEELERIKVQKIAEAFERERQRLEKFPPSEEE